MSEVGTNYACMRELRWFGPPATCTAATVALRRPPTNSPCELARAHNAEAVSVGPGIRRARASFRDCEDRARLRLRTSRRANARTCDWDEGSISPERVAARNADRVGVRWTNPRAPPIDGGIYGGVGE